LAAAPLGAMSLREASERLGLSNKHLIELFRRHVGLTPKVLMRVRRLHGALGPLSQGAAGADLAAGLGYADQAHFIHEFRQFAGVTPGEFARRCGEDRESLVL
jgi:AraC-like DNA-binding protein